MIRITILVVIGGVTIFNSSRGEGDNLTTGRAGSFGTYVTDKIPGRPGVTAGGHPFAPGDPGIHPMKHRVGITGLHGFLGTNLAKFLRRYRDWIEITPYRRDIFSNQRELIDFCRSCDTIVHFAAMTRGDEETVYRVNMDLVRSLCSALEHVEHAPHVIFPSSVHEDQDTGYGRSKREGRLLLEKWSRENEAPCTGLVIPNVFGPFGRPFYVSFIATFCYQLTHGQDPEIHIDATMNLVHVEELMDLLVTLIRTVPPDPCIPVPPTGVFRVSEVLRKLTGYRDLYFEQGIVPPLDDSFDRRLFTTFCSYIDPAHFPIPLEMSREGDGRAIALREDTARGQAVVSVIPPGASRGNHYHTGKFERFCVVLGTASLRVRRIDSDEVAEYHLDGDTPGMVDIPVYHTHAVTNTGASDLVAVVWSIGTGDQDTFFDRT